MSELTTIRSVIFDVGGVLDASDDRAAEKAEHERLAAELGVGRGEMWSQFFRSEPWQLARTGKITDVEFWNRCLAPYGIHESEAQSAFAERLMASKRVIPAMRALLDELHGRTRLAIISNASDNLEGLLEKRFKISHYFEVVINSARVGYAKPEREIYEIALERLALNPAETVFTDDQQHNVDAAAELGMQAVLFEGVESFRRFLVKLGVL